MELMIYRVLCFSLIVLFVLFCIFRQKIVRFWRNYKFSKLIIDIHNTPIFHKVEDSNNDDHVIIKFCWLHESIIEKMKESKFPLINNKEFSNFGHSGLRLKLIKIKINSLISELSFFQHPYLWIKLNFFNFFINHLLFLSYLFPKKFLAYSKSFLGGQ